MIRTTINIDDALLTDAKKVAADQGLSLSKLISESLRERISRSRDRVQSRYVPVRFDGGPTQPGVDLNDNAALRDAMDQK